MQILLSIRPGARLLACMCMLATAGNVFAGFRATLVRADFERRDVQIERIDNQGVHYREGEAPVQSLPMNQVLWIERPPVRYVGSDAQQGGAFQLELRDGQRWAGTPGVIDGETLEWNSATLGAAKVPLKDVRQISRRQPDPREMDMSPAEPVGSIVQDELHLSNGDVVSGVISGGDRTSVVCQTSDGQSVTIAWDNVRQVRLAAAGEPTFSSARFRVELIDGSVVAVDAIAVQNDQVRLAGRDTKFDLNGLRAIECRGGDVRLLSHVKPASSEYAPYFPRTTPKSTPASPASLNVAGMTTRSAVAARPRSRMTWTLDGAAKRFRTTYAVADGRPLADVTVRVLLDDQMVHEQTHVRTGQLSQVVDVPLNNARTLTLEVDFGETYDVQDLLYWIEPALLPQ